MLRLVIWLGSKLAPVHSRVHESLTFLLDHPRRCFIYLFPPPQTWFLLLTLLFLKYVTRGSQSAVHKLLTEFTASFTDWVCFLVLDLGNPVIESIPKGQRAFDGLFQAIAVRAAGFQSVSVLRLAPAVQVLYTIMMYLAAFPIAMSVRSTNVYEERSLGIYADDDDEGSYADADNSRPGWYAYLMRHARAQLSFDLGWLAFFVWLLCIVEKPQLEKAENQSWFTVLSCIFELTSAYGTVGLSMGTPTDNFSLSGRFNVLGKLIVIAVMLRGRHRGLPAAIDRAILLPGDLDGDSVGGWYSPTDDSRCPIEQDGAEPAAAARPSLGLPFSGFPAHVPASVHHHAAKQDQDCDRSSARRHCAAIVTSRGSDAPLEMLRTESPVSMVEHSFA